MKEQGKLSRNTTLTVEIRIEIMILTEASIVSQFCKIRAFL